MAVDGYAADADSPAEMGFQGFLTDGNGDPRGSDGPVNLDITFRIYKDPTKPASDAIWAELQVVTVDNGHFSVILGQGTPKEPLDADRDLAKHFTKDIKDGRYLGIQVGNEAEITPRIRFLAAPYAHLARFANGLVGANGAPILATDGEGTTTLADGKGTARLAVRGAITTDSLEVAGNGKFDGEVQANKLVVANEAIFLKGVQSDGPVTLKKANSVQFGETSRIGLNLLSSDPDTLDILGAGGTGQRFLKFWAEGGAAFTGNVTGQVFSGQQFVGSGTQLSGVAKLADPNRFDGFQTINNHLQLGLVSTYSGGGVIDNRRPGWGKALVFSGAPTPPQASNGENSDPVWMARYNVANNQSELRVVLGNDGDSGDKWVLGTRSVDYNSNTTGDDTSWKPKFSVDANGTIWSAGGATIDGPIYVKGSYKPISFPIPGFIKTLAYFDQNGVNPEDKFLWDARDIYHNEYIGLDVDEDVLAERYYVRSDRRIKTPGGRSSSDEDLKTLREIEIIDYVYKDRSRYGSRPNKKVIAQQVEEIYPIAVSLSTGVVPDIYQNGYSGGGWLSVAADMAKGDRVRVVTSKGEAIHAVREVDSMVPKPGGERRYRLEPSLEDGEVFVYGREVDDFRSVDYEAIAMLNVSATQELAKQMEQQRTEMGQIRSRLSEALRANEALTQALSSRDERLARLEARLALLTASIESASEKEASSAVVVAASQR